MPVQPELVRELAQAREQVQAQLRVRARGVRWQRGLRWWLKAVAAQVARWWVERVSRLALPAPLRGHPVPREAARPGKSFF